MKFHGIEKVDRARFPYFNVIAYHDHCTDGIMAAAAAEHFVGTAEFIPVQYGQDLPARILRVGGTILFVDFCPEREQLSQIAGLWADYFVIDHHKSREWTAEEPWRDHVFYSPDHSGAYLTWHWFAGNADRDPDMILYVQDRDLWQWRLPNSREVSAALNEEPKTVERFSELLWESPEDLVPVGKVLLRSRTRHAEGMAKKAFEIPKFLTGAQLQRPLGTIRAVNATEHISEVGEEVLRAFPETPVACVFFQVDELTVQLSFRSRAHQPEAWTALRVAQGFGGGGHEHAAGARVSLAVWSSLCEWARIASV